MSELIRCDSCQRETWVCEANGWMTLDALSGRDRNRWQPAHLCGMWCLLDFARANSAPRDMPPKPTPPPLRNLREGALS